MRRWFRSLIVALLCLTLLVDTAKACWFLRHLRRGRTCRPVTCQPGCPLPPCIPCEPIDTDCAAIVEEHAAAVSSEEFSARTASVAAAPAPPADAPVVGKQDAAAGESVVTHAPTLVVGPQPSASPPAKGHESVAPAATPTPAAAPMPLEQAAPAVPETERLAAREPLPDLKPAQPAGPALVAPASNDEPVTEPVAEEKIAAPSDGGDSSQPAAEKPMPAAEPAPVADLAGGPETKPTPRAAQEPNLFDLYGDEEIDEEAMPADHPADPGADDAPARQEPDDVDEPEMTDEDAANTDAEAGDEDAAEEAEEMAEEQPAETDAAEDAPDEAADVVPAEPAEAGEEAADERPNEEPAATEADPGEAAFAVPDELMRRWTDDTGTRHAQGWLVELRADRVRILKVNGRHTTVALESLSTADRDYIKAVATRLAADRNEQTPATTTTAGL